VPYPAAIVDIVQAVGSSLQIAAGMIPLLVIVSWMLGKELTLYFANFETIVMFVSVMLVNLLLQDGKSSCRRWWRCGAHFPTSLFVTVIPN
jgi:calcium/proton exchanger cax